MLATALSPDARVTFELTIREQVGNTLELGAYDTATGRLLQRWSVATHQSFGGEMVTTDTSGGYLLVAAFPSPANSGGIQFTIIRVATGQMSTLSVAQSSAPWDVAW